MEAMTPPRLTDERIAEMIENREKWRDDMLSNGFPPFTSDSQQVGIDNVLALHELRALRSERVKLVEGLRKLAVRPTGHHDCDDYSRGYGDAAANVATIAQALLSSIDDKESGK